MTDLYCRLSTEIQQEIFQFLVDDSKKDSVATALRVNKSWFAHAVPVLYRVVTNLRAIFGLLRSPNAKTYLSCIFHIVFEGGCHRADLAGIRGTTPFLPNLKSVSVKPPFVPLLEKKDNYEEEYSLFPIAILLQRSVRDFSCIGGILTRDFLTILKRKCPNLEKLELKFRGRSNVRQIDEDYLRCWFRDMPSLHSVSIFNHGHIGNEDEDDLIEELVSDKLVSDLLGRRLMTLGLERYPKKLSQLDESEAFYSLRDLRIVLRQDMCDNLSRFCSLRNLHVRIDGPVKEKLFPSISLMVKLKSLKIIFGDVPLLKTEDIMSIGNLHDLKRLEIRTSRKGYKDQFFNSNRGNTKVFPIQVYTSFNEDRFDELVSLCPKMRHCLIMFNWAPDSCRVLKSVATAWPNIEYLGLGYNIDIHESLIYNSPGVKTPLLPCLKTFMIVRKIVLDVSVEVAQSRRSGSNPRGFRARAYRTMRQAFPAIKNIELSPWFYKYLYEGQDLPRITPTVQIDLESEPDFETYYEGIIKWWE